MLLDEYRAEIELLEPDFIGPTWQRTDAGKWLLPEHTLGWEVIGWAAEYLNAVDGSGGTFRFTPEQARFVLWWYAINEQGEFVYRTGVLQRLKGWGKDPLLAVICLVEFVGPCRFDGWAENGEPKAKPHGNSLVQIAAVDQEQTGNTGDMFPVLMSDKLIKLHGIKPGIELIRAHNARDKIQLVTSNYRSLEGKRSTFVVLNETHHWIKGNGGIKMYETIDGNTTKMDGRYMSITNAYLPGENSVAESQRADFEKIRTGQAIDNGLLYDSVEAHPDTPLTVEALEIVVPKIRGDAVWLKVPGIISSIQTGSIAPARSRRMWLNQVVAGEDNLHQPGLWRAMARPGERLKDGDEIVLGFDGGKSDDATALIALRIKDMFVFPLGIWQKPDSYIDPDMKWQVDRRAVNNAVHHAFATYKVRGMYADVNLWESYLADWQEAYGDTVAVKASPYKPFEWDMRGGATPGGSKKVVEAHEGLMTAMQDKRLRHPGDGLVKGALLQSHVLNAKRRDTVHGVSFGKDSGARSAKIDAYAALVLAHKCLTDYRLRGENPDEASDGSEVWFF